MTFSNPNAIEHSSPASTICRARNSAVLPVLQLLFTCIAVNIFTYTSCAARTLMMGIWVMPSEYNAR